MFKKLISVAGLCAAAAFATLTTAGSAQACVAMGAPTVLVDLDKGGTGHALILEYDCQVMISKTTCAVGIRLSDDYGSGIRIRNARFVSLITQARVNGFEPEFSENTGAGFAKILDGNWFGFSGLYATFPQPKGGLGIQIEFDYDEGLAPDEIVAAFVGGHVGLTEGDDAGNLTIGHHLEIIEIANARLDKHWR
ncbi:MAG: hypothetical protein QNJ44_24480 [Rhodobacter sp.]|nr:hypothetical protein [Rhodobacter sp.]